MTITVKPDRLIIARSCDYCGHIGPESEEWFERHWERGDLATVHRICPGCRDKDPAPLHERDA